MIINLGYVAISVKMKDSSPNKTVTLKNLEKFDRSQWFKRVRDISKINIANTIRLLRYNKAYGIKMYRFTSKLVPFATHPEFRGWDWRSELGEDFEKLGEVVRETEIRVSTHPDHFTILNSPRQDVVETASRDLDYHCTMFELMGLGSEYKMNIHVGGMYKNKVDSIKRFYEGYAALEDRIKKRIVLENDDKIFNSEEVLGICQKLGVPMVVDVHHDLCNQSDHDLKDLVSDIWNTWKGQKIPPKIHLSSSKSEKEIRSHHDYINPEDFIRFIDILRINPRDIDVMIEAKMKDEAVFKLMEDIKEYDFIKKNGNASLEIL